MSHPGGGSGTGPGGGSGTGPGRIVDDELRPVSLLPTVGMVIRDAERALAQALAIVNRAIDPASLPPAGSTFDRLDLLRESAGFHVEAALRDLRDIAKLPLPAVGSAVKLPLVSGEEEPTPGSAAAHGGAGESAGGLLPLGAGASSDPSPGSGAPVSPPARGVGLRMVWPGTARIAASINEALTRRSD